MSGGGGAKVADLTDEKSEYANRVSRLRGVIGADALAKLSTSSVLIIGLGGLGVEIAKNVILTGVKSCTLYDKTVATFSDLASQFFIAEEDVGKTTRAAASLEQLRSLNPYTNVDNYTGEITDSYLSNFTVVVATECSYERQLKINDYCHAHGIKFISSDTVGVFGRIFCDFGPSFTVLDQNGEAATECVIELVTVNSDGVATIKVHPEKRHNLSPGDFVVFKEIKGTTGLNNAAPRKVDKIVDGHSFQVSGCTGEGFGPYIEGGIVTEVKQPRTMAFRPLRECLAKPGDFMIYDFDEAKMAMPGNLHLGFAVLDEFHKNHGDLPEPFNEAHEKEFLDLATQQAETETLDDGVKKVLLQLCRTCRGRLNPVCAAFGGFVGQEVLKACSAKFTPLHQFFYMDFCEVLPSNDPKDPFAVTCAEDVAPRGNRYDGQAAVFGHKLQSAICRQSYFLVGAGAIGCEMLKNWAMMGVGADRGMIHVTDMDQIERSNLSRQFLFREHHLGKLKSTTAAQAVQAMNPSLNIRAYDMAVGKATERHFNEDFINSLDALVTALDNVEARLYVDDRAMQFSKPMVDSGTLGSKGNVQVVVPRMTLHYGAERDQAPASIAICTLKSFPYRIEHTIQWAKDWFNGNFTKRPANCDQFLKTDGEFVEALDPIQKIRILRDVLDCFTPVGSTDDKVGGAFAATFDDCIAWARLQFQKVFSNHIAQMVYNLPPDKVLENGAKFWSGTKRCPHPLQFDSTDPLHMSFVVSAANLHAATNGIPASQRHTDVEQLRKVLSKVDVPPFTPVDGVKIATTDEDAKKEETAAPQQLLGVAQEVALLKKQIRAAVAARGITAASANFEPAEFEKDDDTNFHVDFMTACSNLRARNYDIPEADRHKTKMTAGNIIPAIATTTALVTGLVCLELVKVLQSKPIDAYKQTNVNLALPFVTQFTPTKTTTLTVGDHEFTPWDTIAVEGRKTVGEFIEIMEKQFDIKVYILSFGNIMLYSDFFSAKKKKARCAMLVEDAIAEVSDSPLDEGKQVIFLEVTGEDDDDLPPIRYKLV